METVTNEQVINRLVESEAGRKAAADIMRDWTAERMNMKATIEKLKRERGEQGRELADAAEVARARLEAARKAMTEAEAEHGRAVMAKAQHAAHYAARIKKLERELLATAPAAIDSFLEWLDDQEHECRETGIIESSQPTNKISTTTNTVVRQYFNNAQALNARTAAIRKARAEALRLKSRILDSDELERQLEALGATLPALTMAYTHEK